MTEKEEQEIGFGLMLAHVKMLEGKANILEQRIEQLESRNQDLLEIGQTVGDILIVLSMVVEPKVLKGVKTMSQRYGEEFLSYLKGGPTGSDDKISGEGIEAMLRVSKWWYEKVRDHSQVIELENAGR